MRPAPKIYRDENYADPPPPVCPVCGKETDTYYVTGEGVVAGCGDCLSSVDAWEY